MANRTFAVGDIHGDLSALEKALSLLPKLDAKDTMVLMGDYLDRGPDSAKVVDFVRRELPRRMPGKLVCLRGNHEDGWLRVASGGWPEETYLRRLTSTWIASIGSGGFTGQSLPPAKSAPDARMSPNG